MRTAPQRDKWIPSVRAYPWERELVHEAAALEQVKVSEYVRQALVTAARRRVARER